MIFGKAINKYYLKYIHLFLLGIVALIAVDYYQLEIPKYIGEIFDGLKSSTVSQGDINKILMDIIVLVVIIVIGRFLWRFFIFGASRRFDYGIRNDLFEHLEKQSVTFYSENKTGGLMAYFTNDIEAVRMTVGPGLMMLFDAVFLGTLAIYKMSVIDYRLTIFSTIPLVLIAVISFLIGNVMSNKFKLAQQAYEDLSDFTNENLSGIAVIKAFVKEKLEMREFNKIALENKDKNLDYVRLQVLLQVTIGVLINFIHLIIIAFGGYLIKINTITVGQLTEFYLLFGSLIWPMMAVTRIIDVRSRGRASLDRITSILDQPIEIKDDEEVIHPDVIHGDIEFNHLTFRYPDATEDVLKDISFKIHAGEKIGIVGRTGSGKTSIVDLLLRLYNIQENSILIDGIDLMKLPVKKVRDTISYVPQDGFLFSDSIKNNIAINYGKNYEVFEKIEKAAKMSDVHSNIIEFNDGYDTVIGERGVTLSGGQRQRINIARALLKDSPIMILDDSVSAVDTKTEETILKNLDEIRENKTTIIIAHRISTLKTVDRIMIIEDGKILDFGNHQELLIRCTFYKELIELQKLEDEMEVA